MERKWKKGFGTNGVRQYSLIETPWVLATIRGCEFNWRIQIGFVKTTSFRGTISDAKAYVEAQLILEK